jgi:hypothetical protein
MSLFDRARDVVKGKAQDVAAKFEGSYRERLEGDLEDKKNEIERMEEALRIAMDEWASKSAALAEREAELGKYYLIPRVYVWRPVVVVGIALILYAGFWASGKNKSLTPGVVEPVVEVGYKPSSSVVGGKPSIGECMNKGRKYYMDLGSYPTLSSGEKAEYVIHSACLKSDGMAFGS